MSDTQYEYYAGPNTTGYTIYSVRYIAQTFTLGTVGANQTHSVTSAKAYLCKVATMTTSYPYRISIREVDPDTGKPLATNIATVLFEANNLSAYPTYNWYEFVFDTPTELIQGTQYALLINGGGSATRLIYVGIDQTPEYAGGTAWWSTDSGANWADQSTDMLFYEYGIPIAGGSVGSLSMFMGMGTGIPTGHKGGRLQHVTPGKHHHKIGF